MPARQTVRRKSRRPARPVARPAPRTDAQTGAAGAERPAAPSYRLAASQAAERQLVGQRAAQARAAELAKLDVRFLKHDLRNVLAIAGLMLATIIGLSFVLH